MSALILSDTGSLLPETIHVVYGYTRSLEQKLSISIPSGLIKLFLLFYGDQIDKFDPQFIGKYLKKCVWNNYL